MRLILTFCEGQHDAAFIYRILKVQGYDNFTDKIQNLPKFLQKYFKSIFENFEYTDTGRLHQSPYLPSYLLKKDDYFILVYVVGGVTEVKKAEPVIKSFKDLAEGDGLDYEPIPISLNFIFDAEKLSVSDRVEKIIQSLKDTVNLDGLKSGNVINDISPFESASSYIFKGGEQGKLENILLPIMRLNNEAIFKQAIEFIDNNFDANRAKNFDKDKSTINIAGQLQRSGRANTVILTDCDYITEEKIKANNDCMEIIKTFV